MRIADCGLRIDFGVRIADGGLNCGLESWCRNPHSSVNPQSAIRNQSAINNKSAIRHPPSAINPQSAIRNPQCF